MGRTYAEWVDGFRIAEDSIACGLAVFTRRPVITPDVTHAREWQPWLWLAEGHDYRAVWSFPIQNGYDKPFGTFAVYFQSPREPTPRDRELAAVITRAAAIIIGRQPRGS